MAACYSVVPRESGGFLVRFRSWVIGSADTESGAWELAYADSLNRLRLACRNLARVCV